MNRDEANNILQEQINTLRNMPYTDLIKLLQNNDASPLEVSAKSGTKYSVDIQVFWDAEPNKNIRVIVAIDDGSGWSAFSPLTDDFIKAPNDSFVGEPSDA